MTRIRNLTMPPKKGGNTTKTNKIKAVDGNSGKEEKKGGNAVKVCILYSCQIIKPFLNIYIKDI